VIILYISASHRDMKTLYNLASFPGLPWLQFLIAL